MEFTAHDLTARVLARRQDLAVDEELLDQIAASEGLTAHQLLILLSIESAPRLLSQIADDLGCTPSHVTKLADQLSKRGLAIRSLDPDDRRVRLLTIKQGGLDLLQAIKRLPGRASAAG